MDSLSLVELGIALNEEFPSWHLTDDEYARLDRNATIGDLFRSLQKVHQLAEHDDVWHRLRCVVARSLGVPAESIQHETRLLHSWPQML